MGEQCHGHQVCASDITQKWLLEAVQIHYQVQKLSLPHVALIILLHNSMMNSPLYNTYQQNQQIIVTSFQPEKQNFIREIRNYAIYQVFGI